MAEYVMVVASMLMGLVLRDLLARPRERAAMAAMEKLAARSAEFETRALETIEKLAVNADQRAESMTELVMCDREDARAVIRARHSSVFAKQRAQPSGVNTFSASAFDRPDLVIPHDASTVG